MIGPTVRDQAIVYDEPHSSEDLPIGWTDEQDAGRYRLRRRDDRAYFGHNVGPHSWKRLLYPPQILLWRAQRSGADFTVESEYHAEQLAFIGVRACELAAMDVLDRVLLQGEVVDSTYAARRENAFIVVVQCVEAGGTCFCASTAADPCVPKAGTGASQTHRRVLCERSVR